MDALVTVAEEACTAADPWQGLVSYLEYAAASMAADQGLRQLMMFGTYDRDQVCYARDRMRPVISRLVERAQASGDLRADFAVHRRQDDRVHARLRGRVRRRASPPRSGAAT